MILAVALVTGSGRLVTPGLELLVACVVLVRVASAFGRSIADDPPDEHIIRRFRRTLQRELRRLGRSH